MIKLYGGDCLEVLKTLPANYFDTVITDPPYGIGFMGKTWDTYGQESLKSYYEDHSFVGNKRLKEKSAFTTRATAAGSYDFTIQGKLNFYEWMLPICKEWLRVCKPGAFALVFGGTRTFHRLTCAMEDAGWEIRDCMMYLYGSGFPKGHDFAYKIHQKAESEAEHDLRFVRKTYLSKAVYACNKCGQILLTCLSEQGASQSWKTWAESKTTGQEQSCVEGWRYFETPERELQRCPICTMSHGIFADGSEGRIHNGTSFSDGKIFRSDVEKDGGSTSYRPQSEQQQDREPYAVSLERLAQRFRGWNCALKPAWEPIIVAMKPLDGTFANNAEKWGVGGLWIDGGRIGIETRFNQKAGNPIDRDTAAFHAIPNPTGYTGKECQGRWPANLIFDEEAAAMLDEQSGIIKGEIGRKGRKSAGNYNATSYKVGIVTQDGIRDSGGASRFFYCSKASKRERGEGNNHPTVKPLALMEYLCKLTKTPTGGIVLDPFGGSGTTALACMNTGRDCVLIEKEPEYCEIIRGRIKGNAAKKN